MWDKDEMQLIFSFTAYYHILGANTNFVIHGKITDCTKITFLIVNIENIKYFSQIDCKYILGVHKK